MSWRACLLAVCVALLALPAGAPARGDLDVDFDVKVKPIGNGERYAYSGRVRANLEECQVGRKVRVTAARRLIGKAKTDEDGKFKITGDPVKDGSSVKFKLKPNRPNCPAQTVFVQV